MNTDKDKLSVRIGVFDLPDMADKAIQGLVRAGFDYDDISVVCSDRAVRAHFPDLETMKPAGAAAPDRVKTGGVLGALVGGAATAAVVTSGGLPLVAVGALLVLTGAGAGSFVGAMTARGVEPEVATFYDQALEDGKILVAVTSDDDLKPAERAFEAATANPLPLSEG